MTLCICQHEERCHQRLAIPPGDDNSAGRCDKIGCYCELFRPDLEDYTDIKFGPIEESPIEGFGEEEIDMWIGRGYQELKAQMAALTAENTRLREAQFKAVKTLKRMVKGWRNRASGHYCQTYNPGMAQGLTGAADHLETYVNNQIVQAQGEQNAND